MYHRGSSPPVVLQTARAEKANPVITHTGFHAKIITDKEFVACPQVEIQPLFKCIVGFQGFAQVQ